MAPKEDLNLPEGDQNEAKDAESTVETVEPAATIEEESAMAAEINLVTEKGTTSTEEAPQSETKNIAAEISALLDASEENEKVLETDDAIPSASVTLRKRLTKGNSEEGRRGSCFLTEIDENADDEVFNPEEVVKNIGTIDNYAENKENEDLQLENQAETSMDEIENIGMIEDDNIEPSKIELQNITEVNNDASLTERIVLTEEEKEQHTPASIVDTILAAARRSASVEQSPQDVMDEAPNDGHTSSMTVDSEPIVESEITIITEPADASEEIAPTTQESKKDDVPIELIEAATTIVDTIIEKAKLVVSERAGQSIGSEVDKDLKEDQEEGAQISEQENETHMTTDAEAVKEDIQEETGETCEDPTIVTGTTRDSESITIEVSAPKEDPLPIEETPAALVSVGAIDVDVLEEEIVEDQTPNENAEVNDSVNEDVKIEDIVVEASTAQTEAIEEIVVEPTADALPEHALNTTVIVELVDNAEPAEEDYVEANEKDPYVTNESHSESNEFIDDIKKEFNDVFVESVLMENVQAEVENIVTSTDKAYNMFNSLPLGELALATLVIFLALLVFNY